MAKKQKKIVLDEYEKEILEAYENGMLKPSKSQADYQKIARNTLKKNHTINSQLNAQFVEKRPYFWWWVRDKKALSVESVVEGVLAYGNMNDVYNLFKIIGREKVKQIFFQQIQLKRCNYTPRTINFFKKVFERNAEKKS